MQRRKSNQDSYWITNISKKAWHLSDLNVIIYPMRSINLLDNRHYSLTRAQIETSKTSGDLLRKSKVVKVRDVAPDYEPPKILPFKEDAIYPTKQRSAVELENIKYEELELSDDTYAEENADSAAEDHLGKWNKK